MPAKVSPLEHKNDIEGSYNLPPDQPFLNTDFKKSKTDFHWVYTDEPHSSRRKAILKSHPEIKSLFGTEIRTFPIVIALTVLQLWIASWIGNYSWPIFLLTMYVIGGTANHTLQLANHEISHNLVFKDSLMGNVLLGIVANIATCMPSSVTFRYYHMDHHIYQGVTDTDTDIPCDLELHFVTSTARKFIWIFLQSLAYAFRPIFTNPKPLTKWQIINSVIIFSFDFAIYYFLGFYAVLYLVLGTFVGLGLHPAAGHFIAEHYEFVKGYETYSYYGLCNYINFNVGYHNEHHDFPKIPWSNLPKVRKIAPEWYLHLPHHTSYVSVLWTYIFDDEIGPWSRVKRRSCSKFRSKSRRLHHVQTVD